MALPNLYFLFGLLIILYFSTFVVFAILRIFTGISIQRVGLSGLRRIAYTPRDGLKLEIRGLGLQVHRPTFAQPTWLSLVITELRVTADLEKLGASHAEAEHEQEHDGSEAPAAKKPAKKTSKGTGKAWGRLIKIKDEIKKLHRIVSWLRLIDVVAERSTFSVLHIGQIQVGSFLVSVDTRPITVDRSRMFQHTKTKLDERQPAEWTFTTRSIFFHPDTKKSMEILDHGVLNIHGFLYKTIDGLRDASIALKMGRLHIPYDDFWLSIKQAKRQFRTTQRSTSTATADSSAAFEAKTIETPAQEQPDGEALMKSLSEGKDFVASILRGIRELSFAISFVGLSKCIDSIQPGGRPMYINMAMKEAGLDLYRLDPSSPAHSMYFERHDVAHQALLSAISVAFGVEDGHGKPERLAYIPMLTATVRTTLPAKLLQYSAEKEAVNRNTNVLFANLVITSPSIDVDPRHLPILIALMQNRSSRTSAVSHGRRGHHLLTKFLPRMVVTLSVHEPIVRVTLPPVSPFKEGDYDFDLLISAVSAVSFNIDSAHTGGDEPYYSLKSTFRMTNHRLYYQNGARETHDLLVMDSVDLKVNLVAATEISVTASASASTISAHMTRVEISEGVRQIVKQLRSDVISDKVRRHQSSHPSPSSGDQQTRNFLRTLPSWFHHFEFQASDFNVEVAGTDSRIAPHARGFTVHLDSWTTEYFAQGSEAKKKTHRRRGFSRASSSSPDKLATSGREPQIILTPPTPIDSKNIFKDSTDGRRLTIHVRGLEAFVIEACSKVATDPFLALPRGEVALSTLNDGHGPGIHMNSHVRTVYINYSLFTYYALSVALVMLRKTFAHSHKQASRDHAERDVRPASSPSISPTKDSSASASAAARASAEEFMVLDFRATFVQVKAQMPSEPNLMIHMHELEASRHRWTTPFVRASVTRLYATSPAIKTLWSRIVSIKNGRVDLREFKYMRGSTVRRERSVDFVSDAIRIGIPHQLVVHRIFDNCVNTLKASQQLHHRFMTESDEYILQKNPEGPKHVPRVSVRTHVLLFELEDGAFEWKLGAIYRVGLLEQKQRLARQEAFRLKCQALQSQSAPPLGSAVFGASSSRHRGGAGLRESTPSIRPTDGTPETPASADLRSESRSTSRRDLRYDKDMTHGLTGTQRTTVEEARDRLYRYNAQSWKKRIDRALSLQTRAVRDLRHLMWGIDGVFGEEDHDEQIIQLPHRPALMSLWVSDFNMLIDKTSFPPEKLPDFMHRVGKGLPKDTLFSLLVPFHLKLDMGEVRMMLRDYPLPLLHIPAIRAGQPARLPSWSLKTDFVIAEEFRNSESTRDLQITVIPSDKMNPDRSPGAFAIDVRRTVSPVKTYSDISVEVNTSKETRFTWGTSYQPAIQDMMQVIESFTKPQLDPSSRVGFWDKIRLSFHSRICVDWKGGGDVLLMLKGSRDPYEVTGHGAGFVMVWRNNVRWNVWQEEDPKKFMTVESGEYLLAVPDFSPEARHASHLVTTKAKDSSSIVRPKDGQLFKKVIMKLSGKVRWMVGLVFEGDLHDRGRKRSFEFKPHYEVTLRNPVHIKNLDKTYDAFAGFRSTHIHMSIAISAPSDRDWSVANTTPADNYNSVHLTPRFFTHFYAWWALFSGAMSLPIRQGALFPGIEKSGKKFGRHLATLKYSLLFSPLFLSHVYKHKDADEFTEDTVDATGLKMRLDNFMLDLHQRREEFNSEVKNLHKVVKTSRMRIYRTFLDLISADIRAVSAAITGSSEEAMRNITEEKLADLHDATIATDLSKFTIPDNDFTWIDVDDFVEIDWTLPTERDPETKILPLVYAPRFTYRRSTDHGSTISGDVNRRSPFGYEDTHYCVMSEENDSRKVQMDLITGRIDKIATLLENTDKEIGEYELKTIRDPDESGEIKSMFNELKEHYNILKGKKMFLERMHRNLQHRLAHGDMRAVPDPEVEKGQQDNGQSPDEANQDHELEADIDESSKAREESNEDSGFVNNQASDQVSKFNNRFVVHDAQIRWNNSLRNILLRYINQVSQRRGFVYYTSRQAVKFLLDLVEEQNKSKSAAAAASKADTPMGSSHPDTPITPAAYDDNEEYIQDRIQQLLNDGRNFVNADDPTSADGSRVSNIAEKANQDISHEFITQNTYHVRLVAPQIQLQSEKNSKAAVLLTARGMRLKVYQIMDKDRVSDEVSGLVQRRFALEMDNMQFFVTHRQQISEHIMRMYSGHSYGATPTTSWPPWMPLETMFDFQTAPYGFSRVVQRTSATLRYDKYNNLRLKYNDNVTEGDAGRTKDSDNDENRMDHLWIDFPQLRAMCDSSQYYCMYIIVIDLLLWSEPLEKTRNEKLEKIILASDFSDLRGAPEMVIMLQERIRQLNEIKTHFHVHEKYLDRQGWQDRITVEQDLTSCEDELFFMMKAITTSQRKIDDRNDGSQVSGILRYYLSAKEIVWHLTKEAENDLVEFQLGNCSFERTDNSDGSNQNSVSVDRIQGLNLLPNAIYPDIIAPHIDVNGPHIERKDIKMLRVNWLKLEAIAGIPVVDYFEVDLFPLKIQLERETGKQIFEYIFPQSSKEEGSFSPFMVRHQPTATDEEDEKQEIIDAAERRKSIFQATQGDGATATTGAGALEHRLQPTLKLPEGRPSTSSSHKSKSHSHSQSHSHSHGHGLGLSMSEHSHAVKQLYHSTGGVKASSGKSQLSIHKNASVDNLSIVSRGRETGSISDRRHFLSRSHRSESRDSHSIRSGKSRKSRDKKKTDDISQMLNRASNYMTLAYMKIPSVVLCLSYKGKGNRNFEDVHNLVFKMPTLEYRNKTWSNLDLALALKKDVIRALIHHSGAIISNKFTHHKPGKFQQNRLRELASSAAIMSSNEVSRMNSPGGSMLNLRTQLESDSPHGSDDRRLGTSAGESHASSATNGSSSQYYHQYEEIETPSSYCPMGVGLDDDREEIKTGNSDSLHRSLTRHLSELTQKARRRNSVIHTGAAASNGASEEQHHHEESNTTPKKGAGALKKLFHSLDKDKDKDKS